MKEIQAKVYQAFDGKTFVSEVECADHEAKNWLMQFVALTIEQVEAGIDRDNTDLADAFEKAGQRIARKRLADGERRRVVTAGALCPVWFGEGETNGLADAFARDFGGDSPFGGGGYGGDEGGQGGFGGGGEGDGSGSDAPPIFFVDAPALPPVGPITPPPDCCGPTPAPLPTPEPSTWLMLIAGLSALGFLKLRRA